MKNGHTEPVTVPMSDLRRDRRHGVQTRAIVELIKTANQLGLEGKRVTELCSQPTFSVEDLELFLKWECTE
jgi:hypothetical protein